MESAPDVVPPDGAARGRGDHTGELDPAAVRLGGSDGDAPGAATEDGDLHPEQEPSGLPLMW